MAVTRKKDIELQTVLAQTQDKALERMEKLRNEKKALTERVKVLETGQAEVISSIIYE